MLEVVFGKIARETMIADWTVTTISTLPIDYIHRKRIKPKLVQDTQSLHVMVRTAFEVQTCSPHILGKKGTQGITKTQLGCT